MSDDLFNSKWAHEQWDWVQHFFKNHPRPLVLEPLAKGGTYHFAARRPDDEFVQRLIYFVPVSKRRCEVDGVHVPLEVFNSMLNDNLAVAVCVVARFTDDKNACWSMNLRVPHQPPCVTTVNNELVVELEHGNFKEVFGS